MYWVRIDNRLVHGQVIENWLPYTRAKALVVVNDDLAHDDLRQEIIGLAIPAGIRHFFLTVDAIPQLINGQYRLGNAANVLFLFATCADAWRAFELGFSFDHLNIGNIHYGPGRRQVCDHAALSREDIACLRSFSVKGVELDFRCVPNTPVQVKELW
nr:PTS sugar transporter subunit IIB [Desulfohalobium retbaense]